MEIREFREGDVLVLAPDGSIAGSEETATIETKLRTSIKAGFQMLVLDCSAVGQLTSAAIRVLLLNSRKLERTEGRLVLCGMNAKLTKAFSISGFDKDFTVVSTREQALQRVHEPAPLRPAKKEKTSTSVTGIVTANVIVPLSDIEPIRAVVAEAAPAVVDLPPVIEAATDETAREPLAPTTSPVDDRLATIAAALLDALGVHRGLAEPGSRSGNAAPNLDALAGGLLSALRVGRV